MQYGARARKGIHSLVTRYMCSHVCTDIVNPKHSISHPKKGLDFRQIGNYIGCLNSLLLVTHEWETGHIMLSSPERNHPGRQRFWQWQPAGESKLQGTSKGGKNFFLFFFYTHASISFCQSMTKIHSTYFSCITFSFMAPNMEWLLPCWSLQVARCRWCWSLRQTFSLQRSVTWSSSSSIRIFCFSSNSCWVSIILLSSFRYSVALLGFSVGFSISKNLWCPSMGNQRHPLTCSIVK